MKTKGGTEGFDVLSLDLNLCRNTEHNNLKLVIGILRQLVIIYIIDFLNSKLTDLIDSTVIPSITNFTRIIPWIPPIVSSIYIYIKTNLSPTF